MSEDQSGILDETFVPFPYLVLPEGVSAYIGPSVIHKDHEMLVLKKGEADRAVLIEKNWDVIPADVIDLLLGSMSK